MNGMALACIHGTGLAADRAVADVRLNRRPAQQKIKGKHPWNRKNYARLASR